MCINNNDFCHTDTHTHTHTSVCVCVPVCVCVCVREYLCAGVSNNVLSLFANDFIMKNEMVLNTILFTCMQHIYISVYACMYICIHADTYSH